VISGSRDYTIKLWSLGSVLDSDGEGGIQHGGVDEEGDDEEKSTDAGDSDRTYALPVDEMSGRRRR
jgi:hypothetical protein